MDSTTLVRRGALGVAALASVFLLAACAAPTTPAAEYPGPPVVEAPVEEDEGATEGEEVEEGGAEGETAVVWLAQGAQIALTTWGSSTCPVVGTGISVLEPAGEGNALEIATQGPADDEICTMDFVPYTTVFWTPEKVTPAEPLRVSVLGEEIEVPIK